ncbi:ARM repeat superfamily protein [Actinidia rufa]|uniref:ARM repeat superfamily protein n=1 Tax=Actinidia rufa TaxID=165716 RepID=A0A7J0DKJ0_9ERIC|nr:ARM repeat superfamily protein [Actinidia rufa]
MIRGASGNAEAIDQAIRGLAEFLVLVLEDDANLFGLGQSEMVAENPSEAVRKDVPNFGFKGKGSVNAGNMIRSLHVTPSRFLDVFALCFNQNSAFAGSLDKLLSARPSSPGYLHSITEMRARIFSNDENKAITDAAPSEALAGILRLVDSRNEGYLSIVTDVPLGYLRKLISEVQMREHSNESWQSWYSRVGTGQLVLQASTVVCLLNEIIFGVSDKAVDTFVRMFQEYGSNWEEKESSHLIDGIGSILHEYLSAEVWSLPLRHKSSLQQPDSEMFEGHGIDRIGIMPNISSGIIVGLQMFEGRGIYGFEHFMSGSTTIRSFDQEPRFMDSFMRLIYGYSQQPKVYTAGAMEWLCFRLDMLSSITFAFSLVFLISVLTGTIDPS